MFGFKEYDGKPCDHTKTTTHFTPNGDKIAICLRCHQQWITPPKAPLTDDKWTGWLEKNDPPGSPKHFFQIDPEMPMSLQLFLKKKNAAYKAELIAKHGHHKHKMRPPIAVKAFSIETNDRKFRDE